MKATIEEIKAYNNLKRRFRPYIIDDQIMNDQYAYACVTLRSEHIECNVYIEGEYTITFNKYNVMCHSHYFFEQSETYDFIQELLDGKWIFFELRRNGNWIRSSSIKNDGSVVTKEDAMERMNKTLRFSKLLTRKDKRQIIIFGNKAFNNVILD